MMKNLLALSVLSISTLLPFSSVAAPPAPSFKKVMIIMFENENAAKVLAVPAFKRLADGGGYLSNLIAEVHPSQANYIALISGDLNGVRGDGSQNVDAPHIGDLLEKAGHSWKTYLEGYPGDCYAGTRSGTYVRKHNPFISFKNIREDHARCVAHLVKSAELATDIAAGTIPDFSLYIPDLNNDGHDTGVAYAGKWFEKTIEPLLKDPRFSRDMLVIATFDESAALGGNKIYGALYGDSVVAGKVIADRYDHYSILRTLEEAFGLGSLGKKDVPATAISGLWK